MPTGAADVYSIADRIATEIQARITDLTFSPATLKETEELAVTSEECPEDGSLLVKVIGVDQAFARTNRDAEGEARCTTVIQVACRIDAAGTKELRRAPGNYAVAIYKHFFKNCNYNKTTGDALVDNESEMLFLFNDDVFAALQVAMAALRLTYRNQAA